jgi:hypothetical protein
VGGEYEEALTALRLGGRPGEASPQQPRTRVVFGSPAQPALTARPPSGPAEAAALVRCMPPCRYFHASLFWRLRTRFGRRRAFQVVEPACVLDAGPRSRDRSCSHSATGLRVFQREEDVPDDKQAEGKQDEDRAAGQRGVQLLACVEFPDGDGPVPAGTRSQRRSEVCGSAFRSDIE